MQITHDLLDALESQEKLRDFSQQNPLVLELIDYARHFVAPVKVLPAQKCEFCPAMFTPSRAGLKQRICGAQACKRAKAKQKSASYYQRVTRTNSRVGTKAKPNPKLPRVAVSRVAASERIEPQPEPIAIQSAALDVVGRPAKNGANPLLATCGAISTLPPRHSQATYNFIPPRVPQTLPSANLASQDGRKLKINFVPRGEFWGGP